MSGEKVDLGSGFSYTFFQFSPDRQLNPQYADVPDVPRAGILLWRGDEAVAACYFDLPEVHRFLQVPVAVGYAKQEPPVWQLISLDPLHIEPSVQMYAKDGKTPSWHGFVRSGHWVPA